MRKRGTIKVMIGANGVPRIMEETSDEVKIYTHEEWKKECAKREGGVKVEVEVEEVSELPETIDEAKAEEPIESKSGARLGKGGKTRKTKKSK